MNRTGYAMSPPKNWSLWRQWVAVNSLAELIGLGSTFAVGVLIFVLLEESTTLLGTIAMILLMTSSGAIEGFVVGLAQWLVLRRSFHQISQRSWILATLIGALVAWFLGSLPSSFLNLDAPETTAAAQEPETLTILLLAALMGLFLGVVLGFPQWRVLRRFVDGAWIWLPANSLAWALGMPIIFAAVDLAQKPGSTIIGILIFAISLLITGAVVGAVHGLAMVRLANQVERTT
jgi:hypothetical protein